jgi:ABC-type transport system involved in cytochrome c biogenesis permease component
VAWWPASLPRIEWWYGPLLQSVIGLLCLAVAAQVVFGRRAAAESAPESAERPRDLLDRVLDALLWPFNSVWNALRGVYNFVVRLFSFAKSWLLNCNEAVIRRVETLDNPVLTAEVRRKARRTNWSLHWLLALVVESMIFLSLAVPWLVIEFLTFRRIPADWGQVVCYFAIVVAWMLAGLSVTDGGQAFDRDRANGTLVFLFLTPLQDRAIIAGKALAEFVYAAPLLLTALPWVLIGCMASVASGDFHVLLVCGFGAVAVASTLVFAVYLQTLFAVRARKPGEGAAKALLCGIVVDGGLLISLAMWLNGYGAVTSLLILSIALTVVHCILAFAAWKWALASMRKQRYGDVTAAGKSVG